MIILYYPKHKFNNKNHIGVISKVDEKNNITNEYLLKFNELNSCEYHLKNSKDKI